MNTDDTPSTDSQTTPMVEGTRVALLIECETPVQDPADGVRVVDVLAPGQEPDWDDMDRRLDERIAALRATND